MKIAAPMISHNRLFDCGCAVGAGGTPISVPVGAIPPCEGGSPAVGPVSRPALRPPCVDCAGGWSDPKLWCFDAGVGGMLAFGLWIDASEVGGMLALPLWIEASDVGGMLPLWIEATGVGGMLADAG